MYYRTILGIFEQLYKTQQIPIGQGARRIAESVRDGGILHVFGSGHSEMVGKEITHRAGGLVPVSLIPDPSEGMAERVEGYGKTLMGAYERKYGLRSGEVLIVVSTSGCNPLPIEVAEVGKRHGLYTIAITSVEYSARIPSRHSSGKRLFEITDLVIDNGVPAGDAVLEVEGLEQRVGPVSTLTGVFLINMLIIKTVEELLKSGNYPPILKSQNLPGADEFNRKLLELYKGRLNF
ncbi:MAG: SIS domain-containing protein [Candidatus Hadarchaeum sp.]